MTVLHGVVIITLLVVGLLGIRYRRETSGPDRYGDTASSENLSYNMRRAPFIVAAILYALFIPPAFGQVEAGHRGVVLLFGNPQDQVLGEGLYFLPPVGYNVVSVNVQTLVYTAKGEEAASHDLQTVHTDAVLNYRIDPGKVVDIYRLYRQEIELRVLAPAVKEVIKAATAQYTAEQLIQKRPEVKAEIDKKLNERMRGVGLILEATNITNFNFSKEFTETIERQAVAQREVEVEKNKLLQVQQQAQQQVIQAEAQAKAAIQQATGQAESTKLRANAEAEAIRVRGEALAQNPRLVELEAIQKWDGKYPPYYFAGGGSVPVIQLPAIAAATAGAPAPGR